MQQGSTLVLGETDPELCEIFEARRPGRIVLRDRDFSVRSQRLAHGGRVLDLETPGGALRRAVPPLARRAPSGQRGDRAHGRGELSRRDDPRASRRRSVRRPAVARAGWKSSVTNRSSSSTARTTSPARTRCSRALNEEFATGPRTLVVGLLREKEPHEMLDALGVETATASRVHARAEPARTGAEDWWRPRRRISVSTTSRSTSSTPFPTAIARALEITPPDGQVIVTGSLYTVGAARSVLVRRA